MTPAPWHSPRFELLEPIGSGAHGDVFRVRDHEWGLDVALKTLRRAHPKSVLRFKDEFRALADLAHPNLVLLHGLHREEENWFLTMELVRGVDPVRFLAGRARDPAAVRGVFTQIAAGLQAVHDAGRLHRDVKPSNVLVEPGGRVALCDFGLVASLGTADGPVLGAPGYVAPELAAGRAARASADWYSLGVLLFEVLVGRLPFEGTPREVFARKLAEDAPDPSSLVDGLDAELVKLARGLLARDPEARPSGARIASVLGAGQGAELRSIGAGDPAFVGREPELAKLEEAALRADAGHGARVFVCGVPGIGKTSLVRQFATGWKQRKPDGLVLATRCHAHEAVPFQGLDGLADELVRALGADTGAPLASAALLFPVLRALDDRRGPAPALDAQERRRQAILELRGLLERVARARPVLWFIDDLHWADSDGAALLAEIWASGPALPGLWLLAVRDSELVEESVRHAIAGADPATSRVDVLPLSIAESSALASGLVGSAGESSSDLARESGGSPLLLLELARSTEKMEARPREAHALGPVGRAIEDRASRLPAVARDLLETLAVAGSPLDVPLAAAALGPDRLRGALAVLRAARLVGERPGPEVKLEFTHDRVRETVDALVTGEARRDRHRALARAWEARPTPAPEALAQHLLGAGEAARSAPWAARAAEQALAALAFERAAGLFAQALAHGTYDATDRTRLGALRGDALAAAGHGSAAAEAYAQAATGAPARVSIDLHRKAAEQLLRCGHVEAGIAGFGRVLDDAGLGWPGSPGRALASLVLHRARLALTGLRTAPRADAEASWRSDVCFSVSIGLTAVDSIRGADFQTRALLAALASGDEYRVTRSLAFEAAFAANEGGRGEKRTRSLLELQGSRAKRTNDPYLLAIGAAARCIASFHLGEWREAVRWSAEADEGFRTRCTGVAKELITARLFGLAGLAMAGDFVALSARVPGLLREARDRSDRYAETNLCTGLPALRHLADDRPAAALADSERGLEPWPRGEFRVPHMFDAILRASVHLYERDGSATAFLDSQRAALSGSLLLRAQWTRCTFLDLDARALLATKAAWDRAQAKRLRSLISGLRRERRPWTEGLATLREAEGAQRSGDTTAALRSLALAQDQLAKADLQAHRWAAAVLVGVLANSPSRVDEAQAALASLGISRPLRFATLLVPSLPPES